MVGAVTTSHNNRTTALCSTGDKSYPCRASRTRGTFLAVHAAKRSFALFHTPSSSILLCPQKEYFVLLTWRHQLAFVALNISNSIKDRIWQYTNITAFKNSCAGAGVEGRRVYRHTIARAKTTITDGNLRQQSVSCPDYSSHADTKIVWSTAYSLFIPSARMVVLQLDCLMRMTCAYCKG